MPNLDPKKNSYGSRQKRIENFEAADLAIFLSYGIGDPETIEHTYSIPITGQTGVVSSYNFYSGSTTYTPTYGIVAYSQGTYAETLFTRHIYLRAYDLKEYRETKKETIIWDTRIASSGSSADLRRTFPVLIAAGMTAEADPDSRCLYSASIT